ncbi:3D domain-containing protein [Thalassotalea litorea]|uniref:3D domain-containing protein n=1 Tax=Thalassotalea litorea TaxID=2020715 RepID=UPI003735518A
MRSFHTEVVVCIATILCLSGCQSNSQQRVYHNEKLQCEDNWRVTGYYTPIEKDYGVSPYKQVTLKTGESHKFKVNFVNAVRIEGWGKTRFGWYLGYFSGNWHKSPAPLNSMGKTLNVGEVAVDTSRIPKLSTVFIPNVQPYLQRTTFIATDVGSAIKQKHVDVYTGEGEKAKLTTYAITGNHQVCFGENEKTVSL